MNHPEVSRSISKLPGVYRDPSRVIRDSSNLLKSTTGRHLKAEASSFVQNDGTSTRSLVLNGTISMNYRGNTYHIPVDIYLPPNYPIQPPIAFVRPVSTMMIKEGHRHVAADGMVYMPYLHSWRSHSHNLVDMCHNMSNIFGRDPPVFAKPAAPAPAPTPPSYNSVFSSFTPAARTPAPSPAPAPASSTFSNVMNKFSTVTGGGFMGYDKASTDTQSAEEKLAAEAKAANEAVEIARRADEKEAQEEKLKMELKMRLTHKIADILQSYKDLAELQMKHDLQDKALLDKARDFVQKASPSQPEIGDDENIEVVNTIDSNKAVMGQIAYLTQRKEELEGHHIELDQGIETLEAFIDAAKEEQKTKKEVSVDHLAVPSDIHSAQMLVLSAENQAINDALYFLDKALEKSEISLEDHLKAVRKLTKKQFLVRAHLLKIGQVKASERMSTM
ncbi:hypothetical protein CTEN210_01847 [Chaetoceros tenuissimus]|uniref:UEV domain-containing protein n=1 Tax=Chaetoceros tenuissimus TaxID=426638 RepID=A0AAD3CGT2_9STRA|nr:hypothetical protein CTEN210_01847 [Chaetoceros tenuissimus]